MAIFAICAIPANGASVSIEPKPVNAIATIKRPRIGRSNSRMGLEPWSFTGFVSSALFLCAALNKTTGPTGYGRGKRRTLRCWLRAGKTAGGLPHVKRERRNLFISNKLKKHQGQRIVHPPLANRAKHYPVAFGDFLIDVHGCEIETGAVWNNEAGQTKDDARHRAIMLTALTALAGGALLQSDRSSAQGASRCQGPWQHMLNGCVFQNFTMYVCSVFGAGCRAMPDAKRDAI
ncbi:hypothetical protein [Nitratireductor aquibiodomus]|uniref:hypothetical protein n=1 Tax=Nitratireductor aquibiodomus TaxID=204799 RepID=UPI0015A51E4A|nr:hypothetical protein [Nitratireductor aquibiodomus]